jgi:hypothetical protein
MGRMREGENERRQKGRRAEGSFLSSLILSFSHSLLLPVPLLALLLPNVLE